MKTTFIYFCLFLLSHLGFAQTYPCKANFEDGWCWGENMADAKAKYLAFNSLFEKGEYEKAVPYLEWLLENTPNLNLALYINGEKTYRYLADKKDLPFGQQCISLLDQRIAVFGDSEYKLFQKKGQLAMKYLYPLRKVDEIYYETLYILYADIFRLTGNNIKRSNLIDYAMLANVQYQRNKITIDSLFRLHQAVEKRLKDKINELEKDSAEREKWVKAQNLFKNSITICPPSDLAVITHIAEKYHASPTLETAKSLLRILIKNKQTDTSLFLEVLEFIHDKEPAFGIALILYRQNIKNGSSPTIITKWRNEAQLLAKTTEDKERLAEAIKLED